MSLAIMKLNFFLSAFYFYFCMQNCSDSDEEVLQGEPCGQNWIPEGRSLRYKEAQMVPGKKQLVPFEETRKAPKKNRWLQVDNRWFQVRNSWFYYKKQV